MITFKTFLEVSEEQKNISATLARLPKKHADLVKDYKFIFQKGNTLDHDDQSVGMVDPKNKTITLAGAYWYGREFILLHEIAHRVFDKFMSEKMLDKWKKILDKTKCKKEENAEESWAMAYASYFSQNPVKAYDCPDWKKFIKEFCYD